ncbi:purine-nucleoside phosphorylase [bacterium]|jgi:purine-nucleoside phosphorylase|nr:purine-nucleoside phosphorylase [bacterium]
MYSKIDQASDYLRQIIKITPSVVVVLSHGLINFFKDIQVAVEINFADIPNFPVSKIEGHDNKLTYGIVDNKYVLLMKDRLHRYEGFSEEELAFPYRVFANLGIKNIILTNGVGAINEDLKVGDIVLIRDHISFFAPNILKGDNYSRFGHQFPDMTNVYTTAMRNRVLLSAQAIGFNLKECVYCFLPGPNYESPSEMRALKVMGADVVGMAIVPEAIVCCHAGMNIAGVCLVTNKAAGHTTRPLTNREIIRASTRCKDDVEMLVRAILKDIPKG